MISFNSVRHVEMQIPTLVRRSTVIIPAKARDYVFTGVGLSVCLSVCYHDNYIKRGRIWTKVFGKVPRGESKPTFVFGYDR